MDKPKIFIVDDEEDARLSLGKFLSRNIDCEVKDAGDGREALEVLKKETFDLVLLDIKMPGVSGIDILKKVRAKYPQTDIVMITAWDSSSIASEAIKEGATDYITKPTPVDVIYHKVCEILKRKNKYLPKNTPQNSA